MLVQLFLMSGVSYLLLAMAMLGLLPSAPTEELYWILILTSFPHFMATYWVWRKRILDLRSEWWALSFPFFYLALFISSSRGLLGPLTVELLVRFTYYYLIYHFAQQLYGVTLWQSYRQGLGLSSVEKALIRIHFLITATYAVIELELRGALGVLFYYSTPSLGVPEVVVDLGFGLCLGSSLILLGLVFYRYFKRKVTKELTPLLTLSLSWIWFIPPFGRAMVFFLPVVHAIQYFPFIWLKLAGVRRRRLFVLSLGWVASGWVLFRWLPFQVNDYLIEANLWPVMLLTLLNNHHFIIDGRIWRLRDEGNQVLFK